MVDLFPFLPPILLQDITLGLRAGLLSAAVVRFTGVPHIMGSEGDLFLFGVPGFLGVASCIPRLRKIS